MLTQEMTQKLNEQLNLEFYSANLYLQMSAWCSDKGFEGAAAFLKEHSQEEMQHMQRLFDYLSDTGSLPLLGSIAAPPVTFESLADVFQQTYEPAMSRVPALAQRGVVLACWLEVGLGMAVLLLVSLFATYAPV